jgi:signal transduction histidine kinase
MVLPVYRLYPPNQKSMDPFAKKVATNIPDHFRNFGKIGNALCSLDWSQSSLGVIDTWPSSLITTVGMILTSGQPCGLLWGSDSVFIYNEAFEHLLGLTRTKALGQPYFEHSNGSIIITKEMLANVIESNGRSTKCCEDKLFIQEKEKGVLEETYFTLYVSAIYNETRSIGGFLVSGIETTKLVFALRRSTILRELNLSNEKTIHGCCQAISKVFDSASGDIPFSLVYLLEREGNNKIVLQSCTGIVAGTLASPLEIKIGPNANHTKSWPFYLALNSNSPNCLLVDDLQSKFGDDWSLNTVQALVAPINIDSRITSPQGVLVIGISPSTRFDDDYHLFTKQLVSEVNNVLWKAQLLEGNTFRTQEIAAVSQEKTIFFTNVVHEFRTPLSLMLGPLADLLNDKNNPLNSIHREKLSMIQRNSIRLVKLVNSIMDFSRIEAGRSKMNYQPTDLSKLTREIGCLFESAMTLAGLEFVADVESIDQPVYVDPEMWEKIITNLISNAFKFTFQGKVELILRRNSNNVVLQVIDTGVGIPETDLKSIFKRFHQVDKIKGRSSEGSGIGLFLVYELVKLHNGIISVKSKVKCGTAFTVTIPMAPKNPESPLAKISSNFQPTAYSKSIVDEAKGWTPEFIVEHHVSTKEVQLEDDIDVTYSPPDKNSTILLAEDNADMRNYIRGSLIKHWNVDVTSNGLEAYELACTSEFDLIISDVMMPKLDGFSLIQMLRRNPKTGGIPIILLTVRAGEESLVKGFEFGADDYLVKTSFSKEELIARARKHIELGRFRRFLECQVEEKEGELHKLDKAYYEFIDMICHEIRNPLHGISGNWELLMERFESLEQLWKPSSENKNMSEIQQTLFKYLAEMKSYLVNIEVCTAHQTRVIDEVVLRAKLQRNNYEVTYSTCDPADLLKDSIKRFDKIAKNLGLDIKTNVAQSTHKVDIDVNCVKQILGNLVGTMIRNMEICGVITIAASLKDDTSLRFEIKCTNIKPNIFADEEVQSSDMQFSNSEGEHYNNVSFGVSLCNKLISLIGGEQITITRNEQNVICLVFVILCKPVSQENKRNNRSNDNNNNIIMVDSEEKPVAGERAHKLPNIRVPTKRALVAEDNIINQTLCKALLAKQGYACTIARDGKEALEQFVPDAYDFILMDITMPELNGFEVTKRIREIEAAMDVDNPVSIIGLSAYSQREKIDAAVEAGMDDFISKPATFAKIVKIIENTLVKSERKKSKEDLFQQNSGVDRAGSL